MYYIVIQIEMMSESIDETLDKDEAEEETEELTNQVRLFIFSLESGLIPSMLLVLANGYEGSLHPLTTTPCLSFTFAGA